MANIYEQRVKALETELQGIGANIQAQLASKDEMLQSLQDQVALWRNKYEALAKLYTQLRTEHLELLSRQKQMALKANSAQESIDKMERMERDMKSKNLELADMIRERDRARFETDRMKSVRSSCMIGVFQIADRTGCCTEPERRFGALEARSALCGRASGRCDAQ